MWEFTLKMLKPEEWNITLGQAKCIDMSALTGKLSWHNVEEGIQSLREIGMLDLIYHMHSVHPPPSYVPGKDPGDKSLH